MDEDVLIPNETLIEARSMLDVEDKVQRRVFLCLEVLLRAFLDKLIEEQGG